ncbi:putative amino acid transporter [Trypanosoma cruzi]|nr:putative amino acid transporter [Trypanosoma cruzi]
MFHFLIFNLQARWGWFKEMALVPHTASERNDIDPYVLVMARQHGAFQAQLTFIDESGPSDATETAPTSMTGLRSVLGSVSEHWEDSSLTGHIANLRTFQVPNFETEALLTIVWVRPGGRVARAHHC